MTKQELAELDKAIQDEINRNRADTPDILIVSERTLEDLRKLGL